MDDNINIRFIAFNGKHFCEYEVSGEVIYNALEEYFDKHFEEEE